MEIVNYYEVKCGLVKLFLKGKKIKKYIHGADKYAADLISKTECGSTGLSCCSDVEQ